MLCLGSIVAQRVLLMGRRVQRAGEYGAHSQTLGFVVIRIWGNGYSSILRTEFNVSGFLTKSSQLVGLNILPIQG